MKKTKVAILGAGFISDIHIESYKRFVHDAEIAAVYSRAEMKAEAFAKKHDIPEWYTSINEILASDCDVVDICLPNFLHAKTVIAAATAGKHIIIEKPLCITLEEADEMIAVCKQYNRKLMYAEELCFAPKYERVRELVNENAVGEVYMLKQSEKHSGPHSDWFYNVSESGGGVLMDMGCHAIAWFRWMLGKDTPIKSVQASMNTVLHKGRTGAEDNTLMIIEFKNGVTALAEDSWAKHGGMDDRIEVYGTEGVCYADLFMGNSILTYSNTGYGYAMEKAGDTKGWTYTIYEELFNQGYPHELRHFIDCVRNDRTPLVTGEDGRAVLEVIYAAYASAGSGKKIELPFYAGVEKPIDLWKSR